LAHIKNAVRDLHTLEDLAAGTTVIHRLHPLVKIITTLLYIVLVISFNRYNLSGLIPFVFYPVILMALAEIPYRPLFYRLLVALPFAFFAGISNVFFDREVALYLGGMAFSYGFIAFVSLLLKTFLTVMAVLILAATTSLSQISCQLARLKVPNILVMQIIMTYRYLGVLIHEAYTMFTAYILRSPQHKVIKMKDMGSFLGGLLLRSFDRADRLYAAMKCRGFGGSFTISDDAVVKRADWFYLLGLTAILLVLRYVNFSVWLGNSLNI
jgi:cobalt/nickel transport system permease protein